MRKTFITITIITLILSVVGTGVIVLVETTGTSETQTTVSAE